ncbi:MAG: fumarylacetoacetase [Pseudomonadales bacterium]|nr:fumarylacetoacetase [Pseudomonadales bacterium]
MQFKRILHNNKTMLMVKAEQQWYEVAALLDNAVDDDSLLSLLADWPRWHDRLLEALQQSPPPPLDIAAGTRELLPFQPLSLRDFMLSESHAINAARGMVRQFMPALMPLVSSVERITRRPFPALKPKPIWYRQPVYYFSNHLNLATEGDRIHWPAYTRYLDYELELALVLARPLYNATREQALAAIGGFLVLNDFSARDVQLEEMRSGFGPQKSKHFVNALSSTLVTADAVLDRVDRLAAGVRINGHSVCETSTAGLQHSIADMLMHASRDEPLHPGEVLATGTLPMGCALENNHWLQPGDKIELWIEGVGSLTNFISDKKK